MLQADSSDTSPPPIIVIENDGMTPLEESQASLSEKSESTLPPDDASSYSTVTPESLNNDDTKPLSMNETDFVGPVMDFYKHKNILMTGATGFIGKAVLFKLLKSLRQDVGLIYVLIRSGSNKRTKMGRPLDRIRNEILNNKVDA
jgi:hypothetical protein